METCANCGRTIGNLETPHVWSGHVVCRECHSRLDAETSDTAGNQIGAIAYETEPVVAVAAPAPASRPAASVAESRDIYARRSTGLGLGAHSKRRSRKRSSGNSAGFVVLSVILLGLVLLAELNGSRAGSALFIGLWFVLLIVRLALNAARK